VTGIGIDTHMHRMYVERTNWIGSNPRIPNKRDCHCKRGCLAKNGEQSIWFGWGLVQKFNNSNPSSWEKRWIAVVLYVEALKLVKRLGLDYNQQGAMLVSWVSLKKYKRSSMTTPKETNTNTNTIVYY
jgi:hypothetical protein